MALSREQPMLHEQFCYIVVDLYETEDGIIWRIWLTCLEFHLSLRAARAPS